MAELQEPTPPGVGETITALNEHLIPFGSVMNRRGATKWDTGWFIGNNAYTYPVLGYNLAGIGTGPVETLDQFKLRVRATVLSRMLYETVSGWEQVNRHLRDLGILDVEEYRTGTPLAWPLDYDDDRVSHLLVAGHNMNRIRVAKALRPEATTVPDMALVTRVASVNASPVWTGEQGTWDEWVAFKRLIWEAGNRLAENHGWCGTFQNVMSSLGIDSTFAGATAGPAVEQVIF